MDPLLSVSPDDREPVFRGIGRRRADRNHASTLDRGHRALLQTAAGSWIEPAHPKLSGDLGQVEIRSATGRQVYQVEISALRKTVPAVVMLGIVHQLVDIL